MTNIFINVPLCSNYLSLYLVLTMTFPVCLLFGYPWQNVPFLCHEQLPSFANSRIILHSTVQTLSIVPHGRWEFFWMDIVASLSSPACVQEWHKHFLISIAMSWKIVIGIKHYLSKLTSTFVVDNGRSWIVTLRLTGCMTTHYAHCSLPFQWLLHTLSGIASVWPCLVWGIVPPWLKCTVSGLLSYPAKYAKIVLALEKCSFLAI